MPEQHGAMTHRAMVERFIALAVFLLLILQLASSLFAQNLSERENESVDKYLKMAKEGDARAQYLAGLLHENGLSGFPVDLDEAVKWFGLAAEQGEFRAQFSLGEMYADGRGVPQDFKAAATWFRRSAEQGNAWAQTALAHLLTLGQGTVQDFSEAARLFQEAANQGYGKAQAGLAGLFASGHGVPQNDTMAIMWAELAANCITLEQGGYSVEFSKTFTNRVTAEVVSEGKRLARESASKHGCLGWRAR
ncbi:MAG: tetratricopeptide repeat protein [Proteobacteria bacterium]|nr:tetratricopeptide repeat protein [Pseudomonadota bacterium]